MLYFGSRVYQEKFLAPRVLHSSYSELFWECRELDACERSPQGLEDMYIDVKQMHTRRKFIDNLFAQIQATSSTRESSLRNPYLWMGPVQDYTRNCFTKSIDKLVALSSIAKLTLLATRGTYVTGFWRETIEKELLWCNAEESMPTNPLHPRHAPTCLVHPLTGPSQLCVGTHRHESMTRISDVCLQYASEDITGRVTRGWLDPVGQPRPISLPWRFGQKRAHIE
jgi:hypothetical protein